MYQPVSLFIGLRYNRARRRNAFISFISMTSMLGIALGVMVLITVLSVMNGFDQQIRQRVFGMANHISVTQLGGMSNWAAVAEKLKKEKEVIAIAPFVEGQGMLTHDGLVAPALITGVDPDYEKKISVLHDKMIMGKLSDLASSRFGIVLGAKLAETLGLIIGDKVVLVTPKVASNITGMTPVYKRFTVVGIFQVGNGFGFDNQLAFINIRDAQILYRLQQRVTGIKLRLNNLYSAPRLTMHIESSLPEDFRVLNWTQRFGGLFEAISMEKTMMFLILMLIIAVAAFNLVSTLVMVVTDKQSDIAILRTLGATPGKVMQIFIIQGSMIGLIGTLLGLIGGVLLAENVTSLFVWLEAVLHVRLLSSSVYYVNYLPSQLQWMDVWQICLASLLLCIVATLYPAWRAARVQPAEALRYE